MTTVSSLSRELLELISEWSEALGAIFGILAATSVVVYLLANKPLRKLEAHDNEVLKERTANAEKAASDAALALAKFKEPRTLSPEQQDKVIAALKPFSGQNFAAAVFPDPESLALLRMLDTLARSAGWKRVPSQIERVGGVLTEVAGETAATIFDSGIDAYIAPDDTKSVPAQMAFARPLRPLPFLAEHTGRRN